MAKYMSYPIYGKEKPSCFVNQASKYIIGNPKEITDMRNYRDDMRFSGRNLVIVDWKSKRWKKFLRGYEMPWYRFKNDDWWRCFRFTSPCEDWELESSGEISDIIHI